MKSTHFLAMFLLLVGGLLESASGCAKGSRLGSGGTGGGSGSTTGTAGPCTSCMASTDCPVSPSSCVVATCTMQCCGTQDAPSGTSCSDSGGKVCDGNGKCLGCNTLSDCPAQTTTCLVNSCDTAAHTCGTTKAPKGTACTDQGGAVCDGNGACVAMHCMDGVKDADETDVDCGGASCPACVDNKGCKMGSDCIDKICDPTVKTCTPPSCSDGVQNGTETDVDCGGSCTPCVDLKHCSVSTDCVNNFCFGSMPGTCVSCMDGTKDGNETDIDCGGTQCDALMKTCATGKGCGVNADCVSGFCQGNTTCALRPDGSACTANSECANAHCVGPVGNQICCSSACNGTCQACTLTATGQPDGTCGDLLAGTPAPAGQCPVGGVCGNDGNCAAGGACEQVPNCTCGTDLALTAVASMSPGGSGAYGPQNINDGIGQSTSCAFAWISSSTTPGTGYFELDWPSAVTVRSMYVDTESSAGTTCGEPSGRNILSGTVQWWNGGAWVTSTSFAGMLASFQLNLPAAVSTTKLRIYAITDSPGNGNAIMFEWHVYDGVNCTPPP